MDVLRYNRTAWDHYVETGNPWTKPVTPEAVAEARAGRWSILLTPTRPVPREWFPPLSGRRVLCLASGGGQQGPILAEAFSRLSPETRRDRSGSQAQPVELKNHLDLT